MEEKDIAKMLFDQEMLKVNSDDMALAAEALFDLYTSYRKAGFTEAQAMALTIHAIDMALKRD